MTTPQLPSGLAHGLPFTLPADWTAGQALAVVELLDDLREAIWSHYQLPLHDIIREQQQVLPVVDDSIPNGGDPPF
jgi:hypothetical protein